MTLDWNLLLAPGYKSDYEMLVSLYITQDWTLGQVGNFLGVSIQAVRDRLKKHGIVKLKPKKINKAKGV
jgi:hypothetical protein